MHLKQVRLASATYLVTVELCMHECIVSNLPHGKPISSHLHWRVAQVGHEVCVFVMHFTEASAALGCSGLQSCCSLQQVAATWPARQPSLLRLTRKPVRQYAPMLWQHAARLCSYSELGVGMQLCSASQA